MQRGSGRATSSAARANKKRRTATWSCARISYANSTRSSSATHVSKKLERWCTCTTSATSPRRSWARWSGGAARGRVRGREAARRGHRKARGAATTHVPPTLKTLKTQTNREPGDTDRTQSLAAALDSNTCRVANRQDARSTAVIVVAETWAYGRERRAAGGEGDTHEKIASSRHRERKGGQTFR